MYIKDELTGIKCDNCKELYTETHNGFSFFSDELNAQESADNDGWFHDNKKHYCPNCHTIDDDDKLIIKNIAPIYEVIAEFPENKDFPKGKKHNVEKREYKKELNVFFASQILQIPATCENCKTDIRFWRNDKRFSRSLVAHILPKRKIGGFPSVGTHPKNRVFLCPTCHTDFDNKGAEYAEKMPVLNIMRERFNEFKDILTKSELERVPKYLK